MFRAMRHRCIVVVTALALSLAACGDDEDSGPTPTGNTVRIAMKNIENVPMQARAKVGDNVVWTNQDPFPHTVNAEEGADFSSGNVASGDRYEYVAEDAGTIQYVCQIHPNQTGSIEVTE